MLKNIQIIFTLCFAIFFKLSFCNIAYFTAEDTPIIKLINTNEIFKVGKKRRRSTPCSASFSGSISVNGEQIVAKKEETEGIDDLLKKLKLPFLSCFQKLLSSLDTFLLQSKTSLSNFADTCSYSLSYRKYLSISTLRI